jgi:hypothetical protein
MKQGKLIGITFIGSLCILVTLSNCSNNEKSYNSGETAHENACPFKRKAKYADAKNGIRDVENNNITSYL